jgi:hypothetical protein
MEGGVVGKHAPANASTLIMIKAAIINSLPLRTVWMTRECRVLWTPANHLLADASFDLSNAAKHLFLDAKLSLARYTLADLCRIDADARRTAHQTNLEPSMKT